MEGIVEELICARQPGRVGSLLLRWEGKGAFQKGNAQVGCGEGQSSGPI